jgi:ubiquinone/menaquinone biosynthesis C-methylase UbiE
MDRHPIRQYYDELAAAYDADRFGNSYGQYLHAQEQGIMQAWLRGIAAQTTLDMGCGTGRFLQYARHGVDFSGQMLTQAQGKFPDHPLVQASITRIPFADQTFRAAFSLHVFFHLDKSVIRQAIREAHRILQPGGILIVDFPSIARRRLVNYRKDGWHGNTALSIDEIRQYADGLFVLEKQQGVMLFPVHRIPRNLRRPMRWLDTLLCRTFLRRWSSYCFVCLRRL